MDFANFVYNDTCVWTPNKVSSDTASSLLLVYKLLAAWLGKSRQVGGDGGKSWYARLLGAWLGKSRQV